MYWALRQPRADIDAGEPRLESWVSKGAIPPVGPDMAPFAARKRENQMVDWNRREALALGGASLLTGLLFGGAAQAEGADTLTIAFNVNLPSFDPCVGPSSVNPTIQAIYRSIFDQYVGQDPNLAFAPGLLTKWGWSDDKSKAWMDVREGVVWHDGSPLTPEDVVWSIQRAGDPNGGNPVAFVWASLINFKEELVI